MSLTALTERVNSDAGIPPGRKWFLLMEVTELVTLHNLCTDHVTIRSDVKYLIEGEVVQLKLRVFGGKTGPIETVWVVGW